ncbi:MAG TPA: cell wall-binding repeat-containing protein [Bacillales bacterium]|nr:cell wall-binding repeat-containing protein [Bacillales bacterium]
MKGFIYGVGWLTVFFLIFALPSVVNAEKYVIIDPGHGGRYSGTMGFSGAEPEKKVNLDQAIKLKKVLERTTDIKVYLTRDRDRDWGDWSDGLHYDLRARVDKAAEIVKGNNDNSVFISIHHNAMPGDPLYRGYETYYFDWRYPDSRWPADPMQAYYSPESRRLAYTIHPAVLQGTPLWEGRGIIHNHLYVTRNAKMPSVLVELGYMTNPTEERLVESDSFQWDAARAMAKGIEEYFDAYKVYNYKDNRLAVFKSKDQAVGYAKKREDVRVYDMETQRTVFNNITYTGVYHTSNESINRLFAKTQDALEYSKHWRHTRVVDNTTGEILWSNYLPKNYIVKNAKQEVLFSAYQEQQAVDFAKKHNETAVVNKETGRVLWTDYLPKAFEVRHSSKGVLNKFYKKDFAIDYAKNWPNTEVVQNGKVIWSNVKKDSSYSFANEELSGHNRMLTAVAVAKELYPNGFPAGKQQKVVVLATAYKFADALSAGPLAAQYGNAPILLTKTDEILPEVLKEIKQLHTEKVVILGGPNAVSPGIEKQLRNRGLAVERIAGDNRIETNQKINSRLNEVKGVFVASSRSFPDALGAAPIAAVNDWAIVLTDEEKLTEKSLDFLNFKQVAIVGGDGVVSNHVKQQIINQNGADRVVRLSGDNRYETLSAVLEYFKDDLHTDTVLVSTGRNFPDALTASSLSVKTDAPLFLINKEIGKVIGSQLEQYGQHNVVKHLKVVGGVLSNQVVKGIDQKLQ